MIKTRAGEIIGTRATFSVEEAAAILGIGRNTAYTAIKTGQLPCVRIGGRLLIPRAALEGLLAAAGTSAGRSD